MTQLEERKLEIDSVVPDVALPSLDGRWVRPVDYKQRASLVIAYVDFDQCGECARMVRSFLDHYGEFQSSEAEVLVVSPQGLEELRGKLGTMGPPFPVLSDGDGRFASLYLPDGPERPVAAVFVTDRYGALRAELDAYSAEEMPDEREVLGWLQLLECECPE